MTPACLIGRIASTWSSRWRPAISTPPSVHHPRITVVLELKQVPSRVEQHERPVLLHQGLETGGDVGVERDLPDDRAGMQGLEVRRVAERHAEVPRVQAGRLRRRALGEVADQLVTEEIKRYPVRVAAGQLAAEQAHVELLGRVQVVDR